MRTTSARISASVRNLGRYYDRADSLGASQCVVVTVDYRLAPEHPYPKAAEDAVESLQWLFDQGVSKFGVDVERIAVGGTSA